MPDTRYWKFLNADGSPCHGGVGRWTVGAWRSVEGAVVPCENGIHACREGDLTQWIGPALHPIALDGEVVAVSDKVVARSGCIGPALPGWNEQTMRLFAADCAAHVRHLNPDPRVAAAIVVARARAFELVGPNVWAAARDAAWAWQGHRLLAYACGGIDLDLCRAQTVAALPKALEVIGA